MLALFERWLKSQREEYREVMIRISANVPNPVESVEHVVWHGMLKQWWKD